MENTEVVDFERVFADFLLYPIKIKLNDSVIREGILRLVSTKNNIITFLIEGATGIREYELFYPFGFIQKDSDTILFDYRISALEHTTWVDGEKILHYPSVEKSKFLESTVTISRHAN